MVEILKRFLAFLANLSQLTESTIDDQAVKLLEAICADKEIQNWIKNLLPSLKFGFNPAKADALTIPANVLEKFKLRGFSEADIKAQLPFLTIMGLSAENQDIPAQVVNDARHRFLASQDAKNNTLESGQPIEGGDSGKAVA